MAIKYVLNVNSQKNQDWHVEIDVPSYSGQPIELIGDRNPILIEYSGGSNDNPFDNHIIPQSATFRVYDDGIDIEDLQLVSDASVKCRVYLNGLLKHQGFIVSDGIMQPDSGVGSLITIKSIDGLELLNGVRFLWGDNYGTITVDGQQSSQRCPMNFIRLILYRPENLDNILPIRWATSLRSKQYPNDDMLSGRNKLNYDGKLTQTENNTGYWYLENILKTAQCWFYQRDGYWYIENRADTIRNGGFMMGWEITTSTTAQVATPIEIDLNTEDLALDFIDGDQYWMMKKPLGGVNVTYNPVRSQNILPNGGFDQWSLGSLMDWKFRAGQGSPMMELFQPLSLRTGNSVKLTNDGSATEDAILEMRYPIAIDTMTLYKSFLFGFNFMPTKFGFPYDENEIINWNSNPLKISISFMYQSKLFYLNEFGYWQDTGRGLDLGVNFMRMDKEVRFVSGQPAAKMFWAVFEGSPNIGDVLAVSIPNTTNSGNYTEYSFTVTALEEGNLGVALDRLLDAIPDEVQDGWKIFNKRVEIDSATSGKIRFSYTFYMRDASARTFKGDDVQQFEYIFPTIDQLKTEDIASFQFQGKGGSSEILFPQIEAYDDETTPANGTLSIMFYVRPGQVYAIDDVYVSVQENDDLYELRIAGSKSPIEDYEVQISSSFTGFHWSNYMDNFGSSNLAMHWSSVRALSGNFIQSPATVTDGQKQVFSIFYDWFLSLGDLDILNRNFVINIKGNQQTFTYVESPNTSGNQLPAQMTETDFETFANNIITYLNYNDVLIDSYDIGLDIPGQAIILTDKTSGNNGLSVTSYTTQGVEYNTIEDGTTELTDITGFISVGSFITYKENDSSTPVTTRILGVVDNGIILENPLPIGSYTDFSYYTFSNNTDKTLTELYGELVMDWRNRPRKIFSGSIDRIVQCGDFLTIKGKKYVILTASIQGDGITNVLAFEAELNPLQYSVKHTGTNNDANENEQ